MNNKALALLSILAFFLITEILAAVVINPMVAVGLAPIMLTVAAIIRAIRGDSPGDRSAAEATPPVQHDAEQSDTSMSPSAFDQVSVLDVSPDGDVKPQDPISN